MFRNEYKRHHTHRYKSKKSNTQKLNSHNSRPVREYCKSKKSTKLQKNRKHSSRLKHVAALSNYVGAERLTKQFTFFSKGKTSDSISRLEKTMPNEVRARAEQDLQKVLSCMDSKRYKEPKHRKRHFSSHTCTSKEQSVKSSFKTPQYLYHKTGFASTSWKDKLQKSVCLTSVNSILASVNEQAHKTLSVEKQLLVAENALIDKIHPCIKEVYSFMFPGMTNKENLKQKLLQILNQLNIPVTVPSENPSIHCNISESPKFSLNGEITNCSLNDKTKDFCLEPIFTGENVETDISQIFPSVDNFFEYSDDNGSISSNMEYLYFPNDTYENETIPSLSPSSHDNPSSSVTLMPSSPVSTEESPAWKLRLSPVKFIPEQPPTPIIKFYRHKMF